MIGLARGSLLGRDPIARASARCDHLDMTSHALNSPPGPRCSTSLIAVRYVLPAVVCVAALVIVAAGGGSEVSLEGAGGFVGAGLSIFLINLLFRMGLEGERDRDAEDDARRFFDEHGHWPDESISG
jgi:hypothetical protein